MWSGFIFQNVWVRFVDIWTELSSVSFLIFGGADYIYLHFLYFMQHPDHYSRTKSIAEQKVLSANGAETDNGNTLRTCALRLAAVYGPGEQRHIPRIVVSFHSNSQSIIKGTCV